MAKLYNSLPSDIIGVKDNYTAFCFNEACAYITNRLQQGDKIIYEEEKREKVKKEYKSFKDFYKDIGT